MKKEFPEKGLHTVAIALAVFFTVSIATLSCRKKDPGPAPAEPPKIATLQVHSVSDSSAIVMANVEAQGSSAVHSAGVCWDTVPEPTASDSHSANKSGTGLYSEALTGLKPFTTYYVRAYAISDAGTVYGSELIFRTPDRWRQVGFFGAPASIVMHGQNLYSGGFLGLAISTDGGKTWDLKNQASGSPENVYPILIDGGSILVGTSHYVYISNDEGASWNQQSNGLGDPHVTALAASGGKIFAGTLFGVYLSENGGLQWTALEEGLLKPSIYSICIGNNVVLVSTSDGVYSRPLSGGGWSKANSGLEGAQTKNIILSGSEFLASTNAGVFRSADNGVHWSRLGISALDCRGITRESSAVFAASTLTAAVEFSIDEGLTWTQLPLVPGQYGIQCLLVKDEVLYAGCNMGLFAIRY